MKFLPTLLVALLFAAILAACGGRRTDSYDSTAYEPAPWDFVEEGQDPAPTERPDFMAEYLQEDSLAAQDSIVTGELEMPEIPDSVIPAQMSRYGRIGRLAEIFNDSNKYQYAAAERIGIRPIRSVADAYFLRRPLREIASCRWYDVDTLTHSMPYLVPEAASLLETIGRNFADSLAKRNAPAHKFRVTSLLRTPHTVKKLRRVNGNATDSSTHQFGTTFDISYAKFNSYGPSRLSDEELKYILAEVLWDLRRQNKCMVKFERRSPCFHITATGR